MLELILGGTRSGKSEFAERRALDSGKKLIYVATAQILDEEMSRRIAAHKKRRDKQWEIVEETIDISKVLRRFAAHEYCILVDCLTLWLSNCLQENVTLFEYQFANLQKQLLQLDSDVILVSNTVNMGVTPLGEVTRLYVDKNGMLEQKLAALCDKVTLVIAGLPIALK